MVLTQQTKKRTAWGLPDDPCGQKIKISPNIIAFYRDNDLILKFARGKKVYILTKEANAKTNLESKLNTLHFCIFQFIDFTISHFLHFLIFQFFSISELFDFSIFVFLLLRSLLCNSKIIKYINNCISYIQIQKYYYCFP